MYNPQTVQIELTSRCNSGCYYCRRTWDKSLKIGDMGFNLFTDIIDKIKTPVKIKLSGAGESPLHPRYIDALKYIKGKGHFIWQITNGQLMSGKIADAVLSYVDKVSFSIDDCNAERYNKIRRGLDFETVITNLKYFIKNKSNKTKLSVETILTEENDKEEIELFFRSLGVPVRFAGYVEPGKSDCLYKTASKPVTCRGNWIYKSMFIRHDGKVLLCCRDVGDYVLGDIRDGDIEGIYNNENFERVRESLKSGVNYPSICDYCQGGS